MDSRLRVLAEQLAGGVIARREFLRSAAVVTGGTAAGLHVLGKMASAQGKPKLRVWLFKSFVTAGNDVLARHVESWAKEKNVEVEMDWATFGDREQKTVAAIEAGNPPDIAEMNILGPMRYKAALRDISKLTGDIAKSKGGMLPFAEQATTIEGKSYGVPRYAMISAFFIRKDIMEAKGLKPPTVYDPDVLEFARKAMRIEQEEAVSDVRALHHTPDLPDAALEQSELRSRLDAALAALPERCRLVMHLRWREQLRHAEIASVMGISVKGVENQLARGLAAIRLSFRAEAPWRRVIPSEAGAERLRSRGIAARCHSERRPEGPESRNRRRPERGPIPPATLSSDPPSPPSSPATTRRLHQPLRDRPRRARTRPLHACSFRTTTA